MSEPIKVELGQPEVEIDYRKLGENLLDEVTEAINDMVSEAAGEAVENYMRYEFDFSSEVSEAVSDELHSRLESLMDDVSPGSLCGLGSSFRNAVQTLLYHHIDMQEVLINNFGVEKEGGITGFVQDAMKKQMLVNISFVDKEPAEDAEVAKDIIPGPVDEINTRSENV